MSNLPRTSIPQQQNPANTSGNQSNVESELTKSIELVMNIKENIHTILDNVAKCNNFSKTPGDSSNLNEQNALNRIEDQIDNDSNLDSAQKLFQKETDSKYLQEKSIELNAKLSLLEGILNSLQPIQINSNNEFISLLVDQFDEKSSLQTSKTMFNYRWLQTLQEKISNPMISMNNFPYKRFQISNAERKSSKYKQYKPVNFNLATMQDLERNLQTFMTSPNSQIKLNMKYIYDKESIIEIIMPYYFKFVLYLFEYNVERIQVKPFDMKSTNQRFETNEDNDRKYNPSLFERLEENCMCAYTYYRSMYDISTTSLRFLLQWIKLYVKLYYDKCSKCERHLRNGLPPLFRDFKTLEIYHDECRI